MADGVVLNAGAGGVTAATDDCGVAGHAQIVKLGIATDGSATAIPADATNGLLVDVSRSALPTGAATSAKQDTIIGHLDGVEGLLTTIDSDTGTLAVVGGGVEAAALRVTLANDSTGVLSVDDNGGSLTVDGTVAVTGVSTLAEQQTQTTALQLIDDTVFVDDTATHTTGTTKVIGIGAVATPTDASVNANDIGMPAMTTDRKLHVAVMDALPAGTAAIGKLAANSGVDIGDVDVASIAAGDNNIGNVDIVTMPNVTLAAGTNTNEVVGDIAHDTGVSGNPVQIAGAAQDMDDTAPPNRVSAEADVTRLATDRDGGLFVHPHGPQVWSFHSDGSSALTDSSVHAAPGIGLSLYVTDIVVSTGAATAMNVFFEEGTTKVLGPYYLEAVAGRGLALHFQTPKKITANTALTVTTSAAIAQCVDVTGFTAQG